MHRYVQQEFYEHALSLYNQMKLCGILPDTYTFASTFSAIGELKRIYEGVQIHKSLQVQ